MPKVDLDKLLELEAKASQGPWVVDGLIPYRVQQDNFDPHVICVSDPKMDYHLGMTSCCTNSEFIAAMRNSIKELCTELKSAREVVESARSSQYQLPSFKTLLEKYDEARRG